MSGGAGWYRDFVGSDATDAQLLQAWRDGDRQAANRLLERHFGLVHRYFWRRLPDTAEDLAQRTFTACVERRDAVRGDSFRAYLFGVARNQLRLALRTKARGRNPRVDEPPGATSPSMKLARREEERLLLHALRKLDETTQLVIEMHYWEGMTNEAIAALLSMPLGTVKTKIRDGRARLRDLIESAPEAPALVRSTLDGFEQWAAGMQATVIGPR